MLHRHIRLPGRLIELLMVPLGVVACGTDLTPPADPTPPRPGPVISLNAAAYSWTSDTLVRFAVHNPDGVALFSECPFVDIQYYRDGWQYLPHGAACLDLDPFVAIVQGDSLTDVRPLTNYYFPQSGWYRLEFRLYQAKWGERWPEASRHSLAFHVGP